MVRSIPIPAVLLFLLLLNWVHALDDIYNRRHTTNVTLYGREDYYEFRNADPPDDDDQIDDETTSATTKSHDAPTITTIIIIQTNGGPTYHELGGGGPTNAGANGDSSTTDPNDDNLQTNDNNDDDSALKRMISIPTVVGGVAIAAIIAGTIMFMRLRTKRQRAKALRHIQESSSSCLRGNEGGNSGTYHDVNGGGHQRQYSNASTASTAIYTAHPYLHQPYTHLQSSPLSPSGSHQDYTTNNTATTTIIPSAPLEPTISPAQLRERHLLSSLPQQHFAPPSSSSSSSSPTPIPSAPSTKEIEMNTIVTPRNIPPHINTEIQTPPSSPSNYHPHAPSTSSRSSPSPASPPSTTSSPQLKSANETQTSKDAPSSALAVPSTPDLPPPAYTPSAPPLFVLPPNQRRRSADQLSLDRCRRS